MTQDISARFDEKFDFVESEMNEWERIHYNHLKKFWLSEIKASNTALLEGLLKEVEGKMFVFDRPKDDYLPEVYKHLKSKNEAFDSIASLIKEKLKN